MIIQIIHSIRLSKLDAVWRINQKSHKTINMVYFPEYFLSVSVWVHSCDQKKIDENIVVNLFRLALHSYCRVMYRPSYTCMRGRLVHRTSSMGRSHSGAHLRPRPARPPALPQRYPEPRIYLLGQGTQSSVTTRIPADVRRSSQVPLGYKHREARHTTGILFLDTTGILFLDTTLGYFPGY